MNESYFFIHILILLSAIFIALKIGKIALSFVCPLFFLLANLFVTKQIELFSFTVTAADAYTIGGIFALNLLQEYFGKEQAKKQVVISAFVLILFTILSQIHLLYIPSAHDTTQSAFLTLLTPSPRIFLSSLITFLLVQRLDVELFAFFRKRSPLVLSMVISLTISQFIDTIFFAYLALYGLVHSIGHIILVSYLIKLIALICMSPFTQLTKWIARRSA